MTFEMFWGTLLVEMSFHRDVLRYKDRTAQKHQEIMKQVF